MRTNEENKIEQTEKRSKQTLYLAYYIPFTNPQAQLVTVLVHGNNSPHPSSSAMLPQGFFQIGKTGNPIVEVWRIKGSIGNYP
jgi:arginine exporter protein ArgO